MTTIAASTTHKSIACDLQGTYHGTTKFKMTNKIYTLNPEIALNLFGTQGAHVGFAGSVDTWGEVIGWLINPEGKPPKCTNIEFLLLTDKNQLFHATNMRNWTLLNEKHFAIGSGMEYAIASMENGKTPKEAIKVASKYDVFTGGGVKHFSFT